MATAAESGAEISVELMNRVVLRAPRSDSDADVISTHEYTSIVVLGPGYFSVEYKDHPTLTKEVYYFRGPRAGQVYEFGRKGTPRQLNLYAKVDDRIHSCKAKMEMLRSKSEEVTAVAQPTSFLSHELEHQYGATCGKSTMSVEICKMTETDRGDEDDSKNAHAPQHGFRYEWASGGVVASVEPMIPTEMQAAVKTLEPIHKAMWKQFLNHCLFMHPTIRQNVLDATLSVPFERLYTRTLHAEHTTELYVEVTSMQRRQPHIPVSSEQFRQASETVYIPSPPPMLGAMITSTLHQARLRRAALQREKKLALSSLKPLLTKASHGSDLDVLDALLALEEFELQFIPAQPDIETRQQLMQLGSDQPNCSLFIQAMMLTFQKQQQAPDGPKKEQVNAQIVDLLERIDRRRLSRGYLLDHCIASWHGDLAFRDAFRRRLSVLQQNPSLGQVWAEMGAALRTGPEAHPIAAWACFQVAQTLAPEGQRQDLQQIAKKEVRSVHPEFFAVV
mmetsp:Transcript_32193/g.80775  ORF Transcript_32193/g.80775 Transcript_32193/m.80775 type:complete len:504 (-) Transcript_32193:61-1572(-)